MTTNRLARSDNAERITAPTDPKERIHFWIDRGNRILWGQEPTSKGEWLPPKHHLEWVFRNGSYSIEPRDPCRPALTYASPGG